MAVTAVTFVARHNVSAIFASGAGGGFDFLARPGLRAPSAANLAALHQIGYGASRSAPRLSSPLAPGLALVISPQQILEIE